MPNITEPTTIVNEDYFTFMSQWAALLEFSKGELSEENLLFMEAAYDLTFKTEDKDFITKWRSFFDNFIPPRSPNEININSAFRNNLNNFNTILSSKESISQEEMKNIKNAVINALNDVVKTYRNDNYLRFLKTKPTPEKRDTKDKFSIKNQPPVEQKSEEPKSKRSSLQKLHEKFASFKAALKINTNKIEEPNKLMDKINKFLKNKKSPKKNKHKTKLP